MGEKMIEITNPSYKKWLEDNKVLLEEIDKLKKDRDEWKRVASKYARQLREFREKYSTYFDGETLRKKPIK